MQNVLDFATNVGELVLDLFFVQVFDLFIGKLGNYCVGIRIIGLTVVFIDFEGVLIQNAPLFEELIRQDLTGQVLKLLVVQRLMSKQPRFERGDVLHSDLISRQGLLILMLVPVLRQELVVDRPFDANPPLVHAALDHDQPRIVHENLAVAG